MKKLNIRIRITILFSSLFLILSSFFSLFMYNYLSGILIQEEEEIIKKEAIYAVSRLEISREDPKRPLTSALIFNTFELISPNTNIAIIEVNGNIIPGETEFLILDYPPESGNFKEVEIEDMGRWYFYDEPIYYQGEMIGWVRISRSISHITQTLNNIKIVIFTATPIYILIVSTSSLFLATRALLPIDSITKTANSIERENLSRRIKIPMAKDEVGRLAITFNRMIARLETSFNKERQFTADASHELRTPIAIISARSEEALVKNKLKDYREALEVIIDESKRLGFLISQLLLLARSDEGGDNLNIENLNLRIIAEGVINEMKDLAGKKEVKIFLNPGPDIEIKADQTLITMLFIDIIDNAIKYNKKGGSISVDLKEDKDFGSIIITDTGIGISEKNLPNIFDRFYRVDKARTERSTGLGLSIVQSIVKVHGGNIKVKSKMGIGTKFKINIIKDLLKKV